MAVQTTAHLAEKGLHPPGFCALPVLLPRKVCGGHGFDNGFDPWRAIFYASFVCFREAFQEGFVGFCKFVGRGGK